MNSPLLQDLKFGLRLIRRTPFVTSLAIFCLAAGIGLTTFMFSITYAVVGRGLPFEDQDKIISIMRQDLTELNDNYAMIDLDDFLQVKAEQTSFKHLAAFVGDGLTVGLPGHPKWMRGVYASPELFKIMPKQPVLGRVFAEKDAVPGADPVLIISFKAWRDHFASDPEIIGKECISEGQPYTIIGVMPQNYDYPLGSTEVWLPLIPETLLSQTGWIDQVALIGLLADERSLSVARAELELIFVRIDQAKGENDLIKTKPALTPLFDLFIDSSLRVMMWTMFGATFLVLLIACTNVSSLLTARMAARSNELAIRSALGADRKRIISQILSEALLYGILGTAIGLFVAWRALLFLWSNLSQFRFSPPAFMEFRLDPVSILMAVGLMVVAVMISGFIPAWKSSSPNISGLLNDNQRTGTSRRLSRLSSISSVIQLAFSLALLVAAGRLIVAIILMGSVEYPFEEKGLLIGSLAIDSQTYPEQEEQIRFWEELHRNLKTIPGAEKVGLGFNPPTIFGMMDNIQIEGEEYASEADYPTVRFDVVAPGYFDTLGVGIIDGRDFNEGDIKGNESVAIINTVMGEKFWPKTNPIGKMFFTSNVGNLAEEERLHRVIGVVKDLKMDGLFNDDDDGAGFYRSQGQGLWGDQKIFVRTQGNPKTLIPEVQRVISLLDPNIAFTEAMSFEEHVRDNFFYFRFFMNLFTTFGVMALILAAAGVYGIIQYSVSQRVTEIGIRLALGATASNINWMILRRGMINAVLGIALGSLLSIGLTRVLMTAFDTVQEEYYSYGASVVLLLVVAVLANGLPARRAAKLDPMVALRVK